MNLAESERMVNAFRTAGSMEVELTVYPEATHDSRTETYANPKLYEWFLRHARACAKAQMNRLQNAAFPPTQPRSKAIIE